MGYDLYMLTTADSENDLPVFPFLGPASRHDSIGFLYNWFSMMQFLPEAKFTKLLLDSARDAMPIYEYCRRHNIVLFISLNADRGRPPVYKDDFTIGDDGVSVCRGGHAMRKNETESAKGRTKFKCPKISFAGGIMACTCENPCSTAKYDRTVHLTTKNNPRLFNDPPRSSREWKLEYTARTSAERCNKVNGRCIPKTSVDCIFNEFWRATQASQKCDKKPTVHYLRHAFVIKRVNLWMESDISLQVMMSYLSSYLGHKGPFVTYYYYHQVEDAFQTIRRKDMVSSQVIPEVRYE